MRTLIGIAGALGLFAASFALHIVGAATDQGWLFAIAVVLVFIIAAGFPIVAALVGRTRDRLTLGLGFVVGAVLTGSALWAVNDRSMAWWIVPLGPAITLVISGVLGRLLGVVHWPGSEGRGGATHQGVSS